MTSGHLRSELLIRKVHGPVSVISNRSHTIRIHDAVSDLHTLLSIESEVGHTTQDRILLGNDGSRLAEYIFSRDQRLQDAQSLIQVDIPSTAPCVPDPRWTESDFLEAQKAVAQAVALRTLASCAGAGPMGFSSRMPLLTEKWAITGFNLSCVMKPSGNSVSADKAIFTEDKVYWAFFHAGVAAGLRIDREAIGIDSSWILYNKPVELSNRHAGFLLGLGLNGHLRTMAKWIAFNYLNSKHTMTSVGLLLGLAASWLGTMNTLATTLLSIHIAQMLPLRTAALNLSAITQTTAIFGLGLVYCGTQHRRTSESMLSELERPAENTLGEGSESPKEEGYRLAAGLALGFINLARGDQPAGLRDLMILERLLKIAVGSRTIKDIRALDKSTAAAAVAIVIMFMKSHNQALANRTEPPRNTLELDFVRPDIFLLRALAQNLIMWDQILPTMEWAKERSRITSGPDPLALSRKPLSSRLIPRYCTAAGVCFALALRYAGTFDSSALTIILHHLDLFMNLSRQPVKSYDERLTRNAISQCQNLLALCAAVLMSGSGDIRVLRRLRALHGRTDPEVTFGSHLAAHTAIGILFLGGGTHALARTNQAIAALVTALYPIFPTAILDNASHLQSLRHLWVLAAEPRCMVPRSTVDDRPLFAQAVVRLRDGRSLNLRLPALLPELESIRSVRITAGDHRPVNYEPPAELDAAQRLRLLAPRLKPNSSGQDPAEGLLNAPSSLMAHSEALADAPRSTDPFEGVFALESIKRHLASTTAHHLASSPSSFSSSGADPRDVLGRTAGETPLPSLDCLSMDRELGIVGSLGRKPGRGPLETVKMVVEARVRMRKQGQGQGRGEALPGWMREDVLGRIRERVGGGGGL